MDRNNVSTDHQICFAEDYGSGGTTDGRYWAFGIDGSENEMVWAYDADSQASLAGDVKMKLDATGNFTTPAGTISSSNIVTTAPTSGSGKLTGHVWYVV